MNRYSVFRYDCPCLRCEDVTFIVFDDFLEVEIAELSSESEATDFIQTRQSQDVINQS